MYLIKDYSNPITRELIELAADYGQSLEFAKDPQVQGDARRFVRFRFTSRPEMRAFKRLLLDRGFQATLQEDEDDDHNVFTMMCLAAVDR